MRRMSGDGSPLVSRLQPFTTTVFAEMSALATATGSINLGQGFPDTDGSPEIARLAMDAIATGHNQYPPGPGVPELRRAVTDHQRRCYDLAYDPDTEVLVTCGATEGIAATLLALCEPTDAVVLFEPFYDSYAACTAMTGAERRVVTLRRPDFGFDLDALEAACTPPAKVLLLNSPHNPSGKVFSPAELDAIADVCRRRNLIAVTDEVYEHLVFEGTHVPLATLPGMRDRTVTISSAGKSFSFTGWKVGWVTAPPPLLAAVRAVKQFLTYVGPAPFQLAVAAALDDAERLTAPVADELRRRRDQLCDGLGALGLEVLRPAATYFVNTDVSPLGEDDAMAFCLSLPERCGVVAVPTSVFYDHPAEGRSLVRWAFCKREAVLAEALERLGALRPAPTPGARP
jgi:N-succinyldiaminopimelate aminotransferase